MLEKKLTEQELVENFSDAAQAARKHAVFVTRDGAPEYVLLTIENYDRIVRGDVTAYEAFARNGVRGEAAEYDFTEPLAEETMARAL